MNKAEREARFTPNDPAPIAKALALTGGGIRGIIGAVVVDRLEKDFSKAAAGVFDVIAGTSIGGIVALGLAAGVPASKVVTALEGRARSVFQLTSPLAVAGILGARYDSEPLADAISDMLGAWTGRRLSQLPVAVLIPAVDVKTNRAVVFSNAEGSETADASLLDVALATSAAPTYFRPHEVDGTLFADGGLAMNCPDEVAFDYCATSLYRPHESIQLFSVGTGKSVFASVDPRRDLFGAYSWMLKHDLVSRLIGLQESKVTSSVARTLGGAYLRVDVLLDAVVRLDASDEETILRLKSLAERRFDQVMEDSPDRVRMFSH